jgi:hypothetical protein
MVVQGVRSWVVPRAATGLTGTEVKKSSTPLLFEHGERPGPAGKLAGDGDVGDRSRIVLPGTR